MTSFTSPRSNFLSGIFIVTSLNDPSDPRAREHLRSCLHQTNPCAKRKVLSLNKPKGKIYKTKPLDHYITTVTLITVGNGIAVPRSTPGWGCLRFTLGQKKKNTKKNMIPCLAMGKCLCRVRFFKPCLKEERLWIHTCFLRLKIGIVSRPACGRDVGHMNTLANKISSTLKKYSCYTLCKYCILVLDKKSY